MKLGRNVLVLSVTVFFILIALFSWYYLFPLYLKELGASESQIGFLYTLFTLSFTLLQLVGGVLSDRFGRKKCIVWPTYAYGLALLFTALSRSWLGASIFYLLGNLASAVQTPSFTAMVGESTGESLQHLRNLRRLRPRHRSAHRGNPPALRQRQGADLRDFPGRPSFGICQAPPLLEEKRPLKATNGEISFSGPFPRPYIMFLLAGSLMYLIFSLTSNGPFLTLFGSEIFRLKKATINFYFAIGTYIGALSSLIFSDLPEAVGARRILGICFLSIPSFVLLWSYYGHPLFFFLALPFVHWAYITYQIVLTELSPSHRRGTGIGLFGTLTGLVGSAGPYVGMQLKLFYGPRAPFYLALALGIVAIPFLIQSEKPPHPPHRQAL